MNLGGYLFSKNLKCANSSNQKISKVFIKDDKGKLGEFISLTNERN